MRYEVQDHQSYRINEEGDIEQMANFTAEITNETHYIDGATSITQLTIEGEKPGKDKDKPVKLPPLTIDASEFAGLAWVMPNWGVQAVIRPGTSIKDDLRAMIQLRSKPKVETIYKATGWAQDEKGNWMYLHAGGAITEKGNRPDVRVELPNELSLYDLTADADPKEAIRASLALLELADKSITWPLLAATITPLHGPVDFAMHVTGRTGTYKSELMSLFQSHYGAEMDARHLPGSWSSTANALEAQAFYARNAAFTVDDFVPTGTAYQVRAYQVTADKLIRAQGNQSGRARLTDTSNLQATMYPRGIILSTGEDTPEGHSVRARMMILELSPGDVDPAKLTAAQQRRKMYPATVAAFAKRLCTETPDITADAEHIRNSNLSVGHTRTPGIIGRLLATAYDFIDWCATTGAITKQAAAKMGKEAADAILAAGARQQYYLESADPTEAFLNGIRHAFQAGLGHVRTVTNGVPKIAADVGWTEEAGSDEMPLFKARGTCIGWVNVDKDELYIDDTTGFAIIKKAAGNELTLTKQTLWKRLKDAGLLVRVDSERARNTVRLVVDKHNRTVIVLSLSAVLQTMEKK